MERCPFTPECHRLAKAHLKQLREVERPGVIHAIETARAHGDLSENAEYHAAKDRQGFIEAEIRQLEDQLSRAQVIDPRDHVGDRVVFGSTVLLYDADRDQELRYRIVSIFRASPEEGRISYRSPIARAVLGKEQGDEVQVDLPNGSRTIEIMDVIFD